jgi:hypothetical protein
LLHPAAEFIENGGYVNQSHDKLDQLYAAVRNLQLMSLQLNARPVYRLVNIAGINLLFFSQIEFSNLIKAKWLLEQREINMSLLSAHDQDIIVNKLVTARG